MRLARPPPSARVNPNTPEFRKEKGNGRESHETSKDPVQTTATVKVRAKATRKSPRNQKTIETKALDGGAAFSGAPFTSSTTGGITGVWRSISSAPLTVSSSTCSGATFSGATIALSAGHDLKKATELHAHSIHAQCQRTHGPEDLFEDELDLLETDPRKSQEERWLELWQNLFGPAQHPPPPSVYVDDGIAEPAALIRRDGESLLHSQMPRLLGNYNFSFDPVRIPSFVNEVVVAFFPRQTHSSRFRRPLPITRHHAPQPLEAPGGQNGGYIASTAQATIAATSYEYPPAMNNSAAVEHRTSPSIMLPIIADPIDTTSAGHSDEPLGQHDDIDYDADYIYWDATNTRDFEDAQASEEIDGAHVSNVSLNLNDASAPDLPHPSA